MPMFNLVCSICLVADERIADTAKDAMSTNCTACGVGMMRRRATGPGARKVETLDNGLMPRAVERLADAERLTQERKASADPLAGMSLRPSND